MPPDLYVLRAGWIHRLDPRTKLLAVALATIALIAYSAPTPTLITLLILQALAITTRVPLRHILSAWQSLWPITLLIAVLSSFVWFSGAPALIHLGPLAITTRSLMLAIAMALRVDALAFAVLLLLWTTEQGAIVAGLTRLGLPFGASLTMAITMQFVPTLGRIAGEILEAQQARGMRVPRGNPIATGKAYFPVLVPLIISALRMADNLSMALTARGYGASMQCTSRRQLRMAPLDWLALATSAVFAAISLCIRFI